MLPAQPNQSLLNGIECLEAVIAAGQPVGMRELAREIGLNRTLVNRLLMTLAHAGLLERTSERRYQPGPGLHVLTAISLQGSSLLAAAMPHARQWWARGFGVTLGVLWRGRICFLLHAQPGIPLEESIGARSISPALESSAGLVLVAAQPLALVRRWKLSFPPQVRPPPGGLTALLKRTRQQGYGVLHYQEGTTSVGVPLGDPPLAGLAVSRKDIAASELPELVASLRQSASHILKPAKRDLAAALPA